MNRMRKMMKKALVVSLACVMVAGTVPVYSMNAEAKTVITVSNKRTVLVSGRTYNVKNGNAANFTTSDKKIAAISKDGKITPKKTGYVTISATIDGKTVSTKFLCVDKAGTTNSQAKVDKMLAAPNVKKITLKNTKTAASYIIGKGTYTNKTLVVDVPLSEVDNNGTFSKVLIKDVENGTFINRAKNMIEVTDDDFKLVDNAKGSDITVAAGAQGTIQATGQNTLITSAGNLSVETTQNAGISSVTVTGGTFTLDTAQNPTVKEIVVTGQSDIKIVGSTNAQIPVVIKDSATGTTLTASSSVQLQVEAKADIKLTEAAGGSTIKVADNVAAAINVDKSVKGTIAVGIIGSDKTESITAGTEVSVSNGNINQGGALVGGVIAATVEATYAGGITTYKLQNADSFFNMSSITATVKTNAGTEKFAANAALLSYLESLLNENDATLRSRWTSQTADVTKAYGNSSVTVKTPDSGNPLSKLVTITSAGTSANGKTYSVVLDSTFSKLTIQQYENGAVVSGARKVELTKSGNTVNVNVNSGASQYVITKKSNTEITISGDTTSKIIISVIQ